MNNQNGPGPAKTYTVLVLRECPHGIEDIFLTIGNYLELIDSKFILSWN